MLWSERYHEILDIVIVICNCLFYIHRKLKNSNCFAKFKKKDITKYSQDVFASYSLEWVKPCIASPLLIS